MNLFNYNANEKIKEFNSTEAVNEFENWSKERKLSVEKGDTPDWFITAGYIMFKRKYAAQKPNGEKETVKEAYQRVAELGKHYTPNPELAKQKFFELMWKGHLAPSTPVFANTGLGRGDSVSCSGGFVADSVSGFYHSVLENAVLSQRGYGTSSYLGDIRPRGTPISKGGKASGVVPVFEDHVIMSNKISQGNTRRGQWAGYLPLMHGDYYELWDYVFKNPMIANVGWTMNKSDIAALNRNDTEVVNRFNYLMYLRARYGKGYIAKVDTMNEHATGPIKASGIPIKASNLCVTGDTIIATDKGLYTVKELYENGMEFQAAVDVRTEVEGMEAQFQQGDHYDTSVLPNEVNNSIVARSGVTFRPTIGMKLTRRNSSVYKVTLENGQSIKATEYHKFYTVENETGRIIKKPLCKINIFEDSLLTQSAKGKFGSFGSYPLGYLLGLMAFGGVSISGAFEELSINLLDKELSSEKVTIINRILNDLSLTGYIDFNSYTKNFRELTLVKDWADQFARLLGETLTEVNFKHLIQSLIYKGTKECTYGFIVAAFEQLGSAVEATSLRGFSTELSSNNINDRELFELLQIMLTNLGIHSKLSLDEYADFPCVLDLDMCSTVKLYHSVFKKYKTANILAEELKECYDNFVKNFDTIPVTHNSGRNKIVSIEYVGEEDVYDTTQTYSHSLIFNGIVTGNCDEIALPSNEEYSFSCVLSSLNLSKWDEFDEDTIYWSLIFLDCVCQQTIEDTKDVKEIERLHKFTKDFRALGLGTLGWHTLLQKKMLPFDSLQAKMLNKKIFKKIQEECTRASKHLAEHFGEPKFCKGFGVRNATFTAIAPNTSSALLCGGVSQGIEPLVANVYNQNTAAGEVTRMNPVLLDYLKESGLYSEKLLRDIAIEHQGSIQHIRGIPENVKRVFRTAFEIDQYKVIELASDRQPYICQGQSLNLFFDGSKTEQEIAAVTKYAINDPYIKGLYYQRGLRSVRASSGECLACHA